MGQILAIIDDTVEQEFRETVRRKYKGRSHGMIGFSVEEAVFDWIKKEKARMMEEEKAP